MATRQVDECDIFKTLQPKGLRVLTVTVEEIVLGNTPTLVHRDQASVGKLGYDRIVRLAKSATLPPKKRDTGDKEPGGES